MTTLPNNLLCGWNVVVIDDEDDSLEVAQIILEEYGADVSCATNGKEGLELIRRIQPKLVISDISMPIMDGWGMIYELKNDRATRGHSGDCSHRSRHDRRPRTGH